MQDAMEESTSSWQSAIRTNTVNDTLGSYLRHIEAGNLTWTLLRSILFVNATDTQQTLEKVHACGHPTCKDNQISRRIQDKEIVVYWQVSIVRCPNCIAFLSELLAESWRTFGRAISEKHTKDRREWASNECLTSEAIEIMTHLFVYMSEAYERLEKETKDALAAGAHSPEFTNACRDLFGENFEIDNNRQMFLANLHDRTVGIFLIRLIGRHHIEYIIEKDRNTLARRPAPTRSPTTLLVQGVDVPSEKHVMPTVEKGKNYGRNQREKKRRKKKGVAKTDNSKIEASKELKDILEDTVNTSTSPVNDRNISAQEDDSTAHFSEKLTLIEERDICQVPTFIKNLEDSNIKNESIITPVAAVHSVENHCLDLADPFNTPDISSISSTICNAAQGSATEVIEGPATNIIERSSTGVALGGLKDKEAPDQYEDYDPAKFGAKDDTPWTEVVGSHKKSRRMNKQAENSNGETASPVKVDFKLSRRAYQSQRDQKFGVTLGKVAGQSGHAQTLSSTRNQQTSSDSVPKSNHSKSSKLAKLAVTSKLTEESTHKKVSLPSTADPNLPPACEIYSASKTSSALVKLADVPSAERTVYNTDVQKRVLPPAGCTNLKTFAPALQGSSIAEIRIDPKTRDLFPLFESIDPGPVPYYQYLKPFKRNTRRMSDISGTKFTTKIPPLSDTLSLVESLRDAGVEDNAMSSLVREDNTSTMSSSHLVQLNAGSSRHRSFAGKYLDVRSANKLPRSAGNSPLPIRSTEEPVYHYPPPDVLTPNNQEIFDLIIQGPPYKNYPRVSPALSSPQPHLLAADFITKKPFIVTYDGRDAYEVLGNRCPAPLTIMDHPNVNKCIQQGEVFHCAYCQVKILDNAAAEGCLICPGCGPCSTTRYCQLSHLLADSMDHYKTCGTSKGIYPLMWSLLPIHYQSLFPYIKHLTGTMSAECFRQMAHCLVIDSDGIIENPFKAYFNSKMAFEDKVKTYNYIKEMYQFQDKGHYYLFASGDVAGGVDVEITIAMHDGSNGYYREDQRFARIRNAAFLTQHPTLLCTMYRRIKEIISGLPEGKNRKHMLMRTFDRQFHREFPSFNVSDVAPIEEDYCFQNDWNYVRNRVHDLELENPILRAWITEDAEDDGIPADPTARYQGKYWGFVNGPTFRAGSVDRKDWGAGWYGMDEKEWQMQLNRKYWKMIYDELITIHAELEGDII